MVAITAHVTDYLASKKPEIVQMHPDGFRVGFLRNHLLHKWADGVENSLSIGLVFRATHPSRWPFMPVRANVLD